MSSGQAVVENAPLTEGRVLTLPCSRFGPEAQSAYGVAQKCAPIACSLQPTTLTLAAGC